MPNNKVTSFTEALGIGNQATNTRLPPIPLHGPPLRRILQDGPLGSEKRPVNKYGYPTRIPTRKPLPDRSSGSASPLARNLASKRVEQSIASPRLSTPTPHSSRQTTLRQGSGYFGIVNHKTGERGWINDNLSPPSPTDYGVVNPKTGERGWMKPQLKPRHREVFHRKMTSFEDFLGSGRVLTWDEIDKQEAEVAGRRSIRSMASSAKSIVSAKKWGKKVAEKIGSRPAE